MSSSDKKALEAGRKCNATHRLYLNGKATKRKLDAAKDAVWAAGWTATKDTVWDAVWDTTRVAGCDTGCDAARTAARSAVRTAAAAAVSVSVLRQSPASAWVMAAAAARDDQNTKLESMLMELAPKNKNEGSRWNAKQV